MIGKRYKRLDYLMSYNPIHYLENRYIDITKANVSVQLNIKDMIKRHHPIEQIKHMHDTIEGQIERAKTPNIFNNMFTIIYSSICTFIGSFFLAYLVFGAQELSYIAKLVEDGEGTTQASHVALDAVSELFIYGLYGVILIYSIFILIFYLGSKVYSKNLKKLYLYLMLLKNILEDVHKSKGGTS